MGVRIDGEELRRALAKRGLLQQDLAQLSGLSETGISLAIRGRPVRPSTFGKILRALEEAPVIELPGADALLARDGQPRHESAASSTPEPTASTEDGHHPPTAPR